MTKHYNERASVWNYISIAAAILAFSIFGLYQCSQGKEGVDFEAGDHFTQPLTGNRVEIDSVLSVVGGRYKVKGREFEDGEEVSQVCIFDVDAGSNNHDRFQGCIPIFPK